jgi:hypothetical protein
MKIEIKMGKEGDRVFLEHRLKGGGENLLEDPHSNLIRIYYERVEEIMLQKMPEDIFRDLEEKIKEEAKRRKDLSISKGR